MRRRLGGDGALESDGVAAAAPPSRIAFRDLDGPHPDMEGRPRDLGFCHLLVDARDSKGEISLVGKNVFGTGEEAPHVEEIVIFSGGLAVEMERRSGRRG